MGSERSGMIKRCVAEELLKIGQRPYSLTVPGIETYLRKTEEDGTQDYRKSCKVWAQVSSTVYLYGEPKTSTVWASIDLKQRQLFDLD